MHLTEPPSPVSIPQGSPCPFLPRILYPLPSLGRKPFPQIPSALPSSAHTVFPGPPRLADGPTSQEPGIAVPAPREYPKARQVRIMSRDRLERGQRVTIWAMGKISPTPTFAPTRP